MDSSRGGPLSTLILMMPLIVVPALVLLRPPEKDTGFGNTDLGAAENHEFSGDPDDFESMFGDSTGLSSRHEQPAEFEVELLDASRSDVGEVESTMEIPGLTRSTHNNPADSPATSEVRSATRGLLNLSHLGVTRTVWFTPGEPGSVGFAAFVPTRNQSVQYRFASIGSSDRQVVADVVHQIEEWHSTHPDIPDRREN
ncbi:MAG: hypothetical protein MK110_03960 [Fuerstiella sp.]|nr:hypothetical protein [Fuerstiella sp.]